MAQRSPLLVLRARGPVSLGLRQHLATGELLEVTEGSNLGGLLVDLHPEAQLQRFGRVVFDIVSEPMDVDEDNGDPYVHARVEEPVREDTPQRDADEPQSRPHLYVVRDDQDS